MQDFKKNGDFVMILNLFTAIEELYLEKNFYRDFLMC